MMLHHGFPPPAGAVIDDKFVVSELIGSGGMGVVIAARHRALGRLVAIKFLHPEFASSPEIVQRFLREARATSRLKSEHVVGIIDVGTLPSGIPYFVMEHLTGTDLATQLQKHGPLGIDEVLDYVLQALEAIAEAHRAGVVHRDLKPANLLLTTREDDSDFIKVLDFGTSKLLRNDATYHELITRSGSLLGSPLYMSPEQIRNAGEVDARSDIWSLGVVMHELLTGHAPFQGRFLAEIITSICEDDYAPPAREDLPAELAEILMKCLQKERGQRFQTAEQLARAFLPIIRTVASQVSIERILRLPSSAPPPRMDVLSVEMLGAGRFSVTDALRQISSVEPQERDIVESKKPRSRRGWAATLGLLALGALGSVAWLSSNSHSVTERSPASSPVLPAAVAAVATIGNAVPAKALPDRAARDDAAARKPARLQRPPARPSGPPATPTPASRLVTAPAEPPPAEPPAHGAQRRLDGENPFAR
jgi:serine/threonine protein kinase